ncbi:outer membrane protein assembly factor BamE [Roseateles cellulosilyticus]|uniref:Outer membrane protein assembly factor BamE n=1 Tax=Pelomonas cellulosilytica TaxID=2906762 RepID=A0ABS8XM74_9BURK|nr:outer membrane protein assembly factor BamE [Pelomonas sp. P8]MCE4553879.1 outer membrane protein assembly factor BamE [Pelomonas sp. P8]
MRPLLASFPLLALLGGCSYLPTWDSLPSVTGDKVLGLVTPYRVEVVQGNVLTKEMVARVKPGMPKAQVRDLLGSPLLTDVFHEARWDYVFTIRRQGAPAQQRLVVARFDGERLQSLEVPDDLPTENDFVASVNTFKPGSKKPKLELSEAERAALPPPKKSDEAAPTAAAEGPAPGRTYPPLDAKLGAGS